MTDEHLSAVEALALQLKQGDGHTVDVGVALLCVKTLGLIQDARDVRERLRLAEQIVEAAAKASLHDFESVYWNKQLDARILAWRRAKGEST